MKGWAGSPFGFLKKRQNLGHFKEASRPSIPKSASSELLCCVSQTPTPMTKEQWNGAVNLARLMDEVDVQWFKSLNLYSGLVIGQLVDGSFLLPPVEVFPSFGQALDFCKRCAIIPRGLVKLIRKIGSVQPLAQTLYFFLCHGNRVRFDCHISLRTKYRGLWLDVLNGRAATSVWAEEIGAPTEKRFQFSKRREGGVRGAKLPHPLFHTFPGFLLFVSFLLPLILAQPQHHPPPNLTRLV